MMMMMMMMTHARDVVSHARTHVMLSVTHARDVFTHARTHAHDVVTYARMLSVTHARDVVTHARDVVTHARTHGQISARKIPLERWMAFDLFSLSIMTRKSLVLVVHCSLSSQLGTHCSCPELSTGHTTRPVGPSDPWTTLFSSLPIKIAN